MSRDSARAGGELGRWIEDPTDQQGEGEIAAAIAVRADDTVKPDLLSSAECRGDVAVRQATGDGEGIVLCGDDGAAPEHAAQAFDVGSGPVGEVAETGTLTDLAVLSVALAQENGRAELRFGTASIYMARHEHIWLEVQVPNIRLHGYVLDRYRHAFRVIHELTLRRATAICRIAWNSSRPSRDENALAI